MSSYSPRKVIIAMDGSECADYAFECYLKEIHKPHDSVILVHCPEYTSLLYSPIFSVGGGLVLSGLEKLLQQQEKQVETLMQILKDKLNKARIPGTLVCRSGIPGHVVVHVAEEEGATLVVTGARGRGRVTRAMLGSVSSYIIHHCHVTVLVCGYHSQ